MKKWKQIVTLAALTLGVTLAAKANTASAAQITGVKQTDASSRNVKISWDASLGSERYVIEMSEDQVNWLRMEDCSGTDTYISNLSSGHTYYVRVSGYKDWSWSNDTGTLVSEASAPIDVVTAPEVANFGVSQTKATTKSFTAQCVGDDGANWYRLYLSGDNTLPIGESSSPTVTVNKNLTPGTKYWCYAYACRKSSSGFVAQGSRAYDYFKTVSNKLSTKSFGVSSIYQNIDTYYFDIANTSEVDGYQMQFLTANGKSKKTFTESGKSFRIANFVQGTFYQYRVRTFVNCGSRRAYSAWSGCRYIAIPKKVTTNKGGTALKFNWSKVSGATKYIVYMSTSENSGYQKIKTAGANNRSVSLSKFKGKKIQRGKKYYIKIYAQAKVNGKTVKTELPWAGYYYRY